MKNFYYKVLDMDLFEDKVSIIFWSDETSLDTGQEIELDLREIQHLSPSEIDNYIYNICKIDFDMYLNKLNQWKADSFNGIKEISHSKFRKVSIDG